MEVSAMNDKQLIAAYLDGNDYAFEILLNRHRDKIYTSIYLFVKLKSDNLNAEDQVIQRQTYAKVRELIDALPPEQREVVVLRHYADMSFKEIAGLTRVSINTALGRMRYALINIRKMVAQENVVLQ